MNALVVEHGHNDEDDKDDAFDLETHLSDPVEQGRHPVAIATEGSPTDHKRGGPGLGAGKTGPPQEQESELKQKPPIRISSLFFSVFF